MPDALAEAVPDIRSTLHGAAAQLEAAGVENPRLDARLLLGHVLGRGTAWMIANDDTALEAGEQAAFAELLARRAAREPLAQILGVQEFWSLPFETGPDVLTPRPDSETLVEAVLDLETDREAGLQILDLGTGSGCLLLSVLSEFPNATGTGVDVSRAAIGVAGRNAVRLGLDRRCAWTVSGWADLPPGRYDVVISNPPYIETAAIEELEPEVRDHEPRGALDGGADGCDAYRDLLCRARSWMSESGCLVFEHGAGQSDTVAAIARSNGFQVAGIYRDLAGRERVIVLRG
ncbi:MAG: peptide chain release factor N(5)-glutamine methyltransferase [Alphaproteobacteria bacterium]|nr:peptide chain release factor N(5)-glutamine methyltransferase [Alphaproteobacteria bacterium]